MSAQAELIAKPVLTPARYYTAKEVAVLCHVRPDSVRWWVAIGKLKASYKPGSNRLIIRSDDLAEFQFAHFHRKRIPTQHRAEEARRIKREAIKARKGMKSSPSPDATVAEPAADDIQVIDKTDDCT